LNALLRELGPPLPPPIQDGVTPLHVAACNGHAAVATLLLATPGVDPLAADIVRGAWAEVAPQARMPPLPPPHPFALPLLLLLTLQKGATSWVVARRYGHRAVAALLKADPRVAAALAAAKVSRGRG